MGYGGIALRKTCHESRFPAPFGARNRCDSVKAPIAVVLTASGAGAGEGLTACISGLGPFAADCRSAAEFPRRGEVAIVAVALAAPVIAPADLAIEALGIDTE